MRIESCWRRLDGVRAPAGPMRRNALQTLPTLPWFGLSSATLTMRTWNGECCEAGSVTGTRGDVWLAALDPAVGSEIRKTRPCIVVSPPEMHNALHAQAPSRCLRR